MNKMLLKSSIRHDAFKYFKKFQLFNTKMSYNTIGIHFFFFNGFDCYQNLKYVRINIFVYFNFFPFFFVFLLRINSKVIHIQNVMQRKCYIRFDSVCLIGIAIAKICLPIPHYDK